MSESESPGEEGVFQELFDRSLKDPEGFWGDAAEAVHWYRRWDRVLDDSEAPFYRWFTGGQLNTCYNALDLHIDRGRGDQPSLATNTIAACMSVATPVAVRRSFRLETLAQPQGSCSGGRLDDIDKSLWDRYSEVSTLATEIDPGAAFPERSNNLGSGREETSRNPLLQETVVGRSFKGPRLGPFCDRAFGSSQGVSRGRHTQLEPSGLEPGPSPVW